MGTIILLYQIINIKITYLNKNLKGERENTLRLIILLCYIKYFKIPTGTDLGYRYLKKDFRTYKAEYLGELESNGFKTINR